MGVMTPIGVSFIGLNKDWYFDQYNVQYMSKLNLVGQAFSTDVRFVLYMTILECSKVYMSQVGSNLRLSNYTP